MFTASLNLEALRFCAAAGCGKPIPQERQNDEFCSDDCKDREEQRRAKASKASR